MAWSNPSLRTTGDLITVSVWNNDVVENISYFGSSHAHSGRDGDGGDLGIIIPAGMIGIFDTSCPSGWTRVSAFDGLFLKGSVDYGVTGGDSSHYHSQRTGSTIWPDVTDLAVYDGIHGSYSISRITTSGGGDAYDDIPALTGSSGLGGTSEPYPPYIDVVFCKKD